MKDIQKVISKLIENVIIESSDEEKIVFRSVTIHPFNIVKKILKSNIDYGKIIYNVNNGTVELYFAGNKEVLMKEKEILSYIKI